MNEIETLAALLNTLIFNAQARMSYDSLADGLVWSDEIPPWSFEKLGPSQFPRGTGEFRALLKFRSSLILQRPSEQFRELWDKALQLCPLWPGFVPARRDPGLASALQAKEGASMKSWDDADARFEKQRQAKVNKAIA